MVMHPSLRCKALLRPVETAISKGVGGLDDTLFGEPVGLHAVVGTRLAEEGEADGNEADHVPVAHEPLQLHPAIQGFERRRASGRARGAQGDAQHRHQAVQPAGAPSEKRHLSGRHAVRPGPSHGFLRLPASRSNSTLTGGASRASAARTSAALLELPREQGLPEHAAGNGRAGPDERQVPGG